ncbi:MAG: DegT/DnrJ/EryC1/StrS family aminotransferase [Acidimicrobiia bacterium]
MIPISRPLIDERAEKLVLEVLRSGQLSAGQLVSELEERTAALVGVRHAIAVSSGTAALELVFESILDPGDTVITTPFTFAATVNSVLRAGGVVRFADIGDDFNMDPQDASAAASDGVDVLLPVHLFGRPCKLDAMWELTKAKEATMVEDAAQAIGAHLEGRKVGSWGIGCFSLYATKNIAAGEGGLITTDDDEVADRVRLLANQGSRHRYEYEVIGTNRRLTELQAALVLPQLDDLPTWIERRRDNAATLTEGLSDLEGLVTPEDHPGHVYHQYTFRVTHEAPVDREGLANRLRRYGIATGIYYPHLIGDHPCYRDHPRVVMRSTPRARRATGEVLSIPVHPGVSPGELEMILDVIRGSFNA